MTIGTTLCALYEWTAPVSNDGPSTTTTRLERAVEKLCELNDEFAALNERTLPNIEDDPFTEPAMLEENFVEGNELMRSMLAVAPDEIRADLSNYVESNEKLSDLYAGFGYDRGSLVDHGRGDVCPRLQLR